ncbi:hypothetical protein F0562_025517 [Nyssa sinensis]|uniref:Uncharacterized protein n=1 Tax=Nyssa sinensis TaxID=561372 RepID=A0A5J5B6J5_9ASTE|nr:hypothetical protein F0562_025517 [Nyssa sinensis]
MTNFLGGVFPIFAKTLPPLLGSSVIGDDSWNVGVPPQHCFLVEVVALSPRAHVVGYGHLEVVDSELVEATISLDHAKVASSGLDEVVVGPDHARVVGSGLAEVAIGLDHARVVGSGLAKAAIGFDHARVVGFGLAEVAAGSRLVEAWVEFERSKLADSEPSFP